MTCPMLLNSVNTCVEVIKKNIKYLRSNALRGTKFVNMIGSIRDTLKNIKKNIKVDYFVRGKNSIKFLGCWNNQDD